MQKKGEASKRQAGSEAGKGKGNETTDDDAGLEAGHRGRQETHRKEDKFDEDLAIHTEKYPKFTTNVLTELSRDVLAVTNPSSQLWTAWDPELAKRLKHL